MAMETTGWAVGQILNAALGHQMSTAMWEGNCGGNMHWPVRNAVVCYAPTLEVLRRAAAEGKTMLVTREHPFFMHGGLNYPYLTEGLEAALKDDPVVAAKREIIASHKILVYRMATAWDNFRPQSQSAALARALGLKPIEPQPNPRSRGVICDVPRTSLAALAQVAYDKLQARAPRIVGDPQATVSRVAVLAGETDPKSGLAALIADPKIDGVIAGAGGVIDETDGAIGIFPRRDRVRAQDRHAGSGIRTFGRAGRRRSGAVDAHGAAGYDDRVVAGAGCGLDSAVGGRRWRTR